MRTVRFLSKLLFSLRFGHCSALDDIETEGDRYDRVPRVVGIDRDMLFKTAHPPGCVNSCLDLSAFPRLQAIGTDHRGGAASAGLDLLDHERLGPFVHDIKNMGSLFSLRNLPEVEAKLLYGDFRPLFSLGVRNSNGGKQ